MAGSCSCTCHPHTQWGPDDKPMVQALNHPKNCGCACCDTAPPSDWFASEQEAVAEEAAWAEQQEQEGLGEIVAHGHFEIQPSNGEAVEEDAPVNPLDIPDEYDLPMYGSIIACPKCGGEKVKTEYHAHGVLSEPCGRRFGWPNIQNLGEHLCRECTRCKYGWPEECASGA